MKTSDAFRSIKILKNLFLLVLVGVIGVLSLRSAYAMSNYPSPNQRVTDTPVPPSPTEFHPSATPFHPSATPGPAATSVPPTVVIPTKKLPTFIPTVEPTETPAPTETPTPTAVPSESPTPTPNQSVFVLSVKSPNEVQFDLLTLFKGILLAGLLVLLIVFPADMFNSALLAHYEEITGWFKPAWLMGFIKKHHLNEMYTSFHQKIPPIASIIFFAAIGALLTGQLSPDFGFNEPSYVLFAGMFLTLMMCSVVYDLVRAFYMKKRFGIKSKLRTQLIGLFVGALLVLLSRMANFVPGYLYGVFTALVFAKTPSEKQDGEGLYVVSWGLLILGILAWLALIPVKPAASSEEATLLLQILNAGLASFWIAALAFIVFGLAPLRFFYGEPVKNWSKGAWILIYGLGMLLFVLAVLDPNQTIYGKSDQTTWISVLTLFGGFALFSLTFWGYFRYRHLWRKEPDIKEDLS